MEPSASHTSAQPVLDVGTTERGSVGINGSTAPSADLSQAYEPVVESLDRVKEILRGIVVDQAPYLADLLDHVLGLLGLWVFSLDLI